MQPSNWLESYLEKVSASCEEGRQAVEYIRAHRIKIKFSRARKNVGAFWTPAGNIHFNTVHHTPASVLANPRGWTLLIHEVRHLQQGVLTALSVYGELDAWQYEFRVYQRLTKSKLDPKIAEISSLPLNWERENLHRARGLMQEIAGKGYRADLLPLYPLHLEIKYWVTRRKPV